MKLTDYHTDVARRFMTLSEEAIKLSERYVVAHAGQLDDDDAHSAVMFGGTAMEAEIFDGLCMLHLAVGDEAYKPFAAIVKAGDREKLLQRVTRHETLLIHPDTIAKGDWPVFLKTVKQVMLGERSV